MEIITCRKLVLVSALLSLVFHCICAFSNGVWIAGRGRLLCKTFYGRFHPPAKGFNPATISVNTSFVQLTNQSAVAFTPKVATCYKPEETYQCEITAHTRFK